MIVNPNLKFLRDQFPKKRIVKLEGGTRSGKTYSVLQFIIEQCFRYKDAKIHFAICRESNPVLKKTVINDLWEILRAENIYNDLHHNKTEQVYNLNGNRITYFSLDQSQKVRGFKCDVLYINEANECDYETFKQLGFRTRYKIIVDYNPSMDKHWLYDLDRRSDVAFIQTTYKDNPFLTRGQIAEIEDLEFTDPELWEVFGKGERGKGLKGRIYRHFKAIEQLPNIYAPIYGLDFGFSNDPTALIEIQRHNRTLWIREHIYEAGLTNPDIAEICHAKGIRANIWADSAEAKSIAELKKLGLGVQEAMKGPGSINAGISFVKACEVFYEITSPNIDTETRFYVWRMNPDNTPTNIPVDKYNHLMDALRYGLTPFMQLAGNLTKSKAHRLKQKEF